MINFIHQLYSCFFTVDVYNVSFVPSANPLTLREGTQVEVLCVVNSNAIPAPTINWYLESTDITNIAGSNTTFITLTGNRTYNTKLLQCRAKNNNKPSKTASTKLNVECKCFFWKNTLTQVILYVFAGNHWLSVSSGELLWSHFARRPSVRL